MAELKDKMCKACPALKALSTRLESTITLVNELKTDHNAHCAMGAGTHTAADATNVVTSAAVSVL